MESFFKLAERNTTVGREVRAGITTFLAMAYIIAVNPPLLAAAGVPLSAAVTSTCLGAGLMTILMGLVANRPVAVAAGMGINAIVAYTITALTGGDWQAAMAVVFVEGVAILLLMLGGFREAIARAIPKPLLWGTIVGIGLFVAMIGLADGGIIVANESTMVALGHISADNPKMIVGLISIVATVVLYFLRVPGSMLLGIVIAALAGIPLGVTPAPTGLLSAPDFSAFGAPFQTGASGVIAIVKVATTPLLLIYAFSLMMSDFFDTMGGLAAIAQQGDFIDDDGEIRDLKRMLEVDSAAAAFGGFVGCSSITTFVEATAGAAEGGRTGLTSVVTGVLFLVASLFAPVIACVSAAATCGALVMVGFLTMEGVANIDFHDFTEGLPAFLIIAGIPLTYSISTGIGLGFIAYALIAVLGGRAKELRPVMWASVAAFVLYFAFMLLG